MKRLAFLSTLCVLAAVSAPTAQQRPALSSANIDDLATLLKLEDTRQYDAAALERTLKSTHPEVRRRAAVSIGRIADARGLALLDAARADRDVGVVTSVVFATGQLKQASAVGWLGGLLSAPATPPAVAQEAARALGKMQAPEARGALAAYLGAAPLTADPQVVGEALLSWGRFTSAADLAPVVRWIASPNVEIRWRATWALFRPRDPAAVSHLMTLTADPSGDVRYWAVRGLTPAVVDAAKMTRATATERLARLVTDPDRRVKTEAIRTLVQYDDERAFGAVANGLYYPDTWVSVSAAEGAARFVARALPLAPLVIDVADDKAPTALRITCLNALVTLAPIATKTFDLAAALAKSDVAVARAAAVQALVRLGDEGIAKLKALAADPAIAQQAQPGGQTFGAMAEAAIARAGGPGGRGAGAGTGGGRGAGGATTARTPRPDADYRQLVERWIVPTYTGQAGPRAIWVTPKGEIELELFAGDAPFGTEQFLRSVESGDIVGTEFTRLVPDFVAQQQPIRNAPTLRDEVNLRGLTRGNLSWASAGLDTGRPGYTLGHTPQPHNEGSFTALGRVVRGMEVVDRLELGDRITAARMVPR